MSFIKATVVGVNFQDLQHPPTTDHIHADVVLVDRSPPEAIPTVYYLKEDEIDPNTGLYKSHGISPLNQDSFTMVGMVEYIDKEKKLVHLRNHKAPEIEGALTIVSYNHMIVSSELNHPLLGKTSPEEFSAGLAALLDAPKLKKIVPSQFSTLEQDLKNTKSKKRLFHPGFEKPDGLPSKTIETLVQAHIPKESVANIPSNLASLYKKLCEVQLGS